MHTDRVRVTWLSVTLLKTKSYFGFSCLHKALIPCKHTPEEYSLTPVVPQIERSASKKT